MSLRSRVRAVGDAGGRGYRPGAYGPMELTPAGLRLRAALAAVTVPGVAPELQMAHHWLDNWRGVGQIAEGMSAGRRGSRSRGLPCRRLRGRPSIWALRAVC